MALSHGTPGRGETASSTSHSAAYDVGSGARRRLTVQAYIFDGDSGTTTIDAVTYNGVSLTKKIGASEVFAGGGQIVRSEVWSGDVSGVSGSNTLAVTASATCNQVGWIAVYHSDAGAIGTNAGAVNGNIATYNLGFTSDAATSELLGWAGTAGLRSWTATTGTQLTPTDTSSTVQGSLYQAATGGAETITLTASAAVRSAATSCEVTEDTGGGGGATHPGWAGAGWW